jgi:hypothetical protein
MQGSWMPQLKNRKPDEDPEIGGEIIIWELERVIANSELEMEDEDVEEIGGEDKYVEDTLVHMKV